MDRQGDFGLASGAQPDGGSSRVWFKELISADEIAFDRQTFLLLPSVAKTLTTAPIDPLVTQPTPPVGIGVLTTPTPAVGGTPETPEVIRLSGSIPPEMWNRVGNKPIPKLRMGESLEVSLGLTVKVSAGEGATFLVEVRQILADLGLETKISVLVSSTKAGDPSSLGAR